VKRLERKSGKNVEHTSKCGHASERRGNEEKRGKRDVREQEEGKNNKNNNPKKNGAEGRGVQNSKLR